MSRTTIRTFLAVFAVAIVAAIPAIASAHKGSHAHKTQAQTVGTIVSYTDGTLVVSSGGTPVTGKVTPFTRIKFADNGHHYGWFKKHRRHGHGRGHGVFGHSSHFGHGHGHGDWTAGGLPTGGGMPTDGGLPTGGGMPTSGGLPRATTADLKPGTALTKASLKLTADGPVWIELKLVRPVTPAS